MYPWTRRTCNCKSLLQIKIQKEHSKALPTNKCKTHYIHYIHYISPLSFQPFQILWNCMRHCMHDSRLTSKLWIFWAERRKKSRKDREKREPDLPKQPSWASVGCVLSHSNLMFLANWREMLAKLPIWLKFRSMWRSREIQVFKCPAARITWIQLLE